MDTILFGIIAATVIVCGPLLVFVGVRALWRYVCYGRWAE